ncbi:hypothetical protein B0J13DRAFT_517824 [Dactylonectria estremocensis]|uniref:Uncharacterized protein n=1 Tax=Dactylonectria estremocensis TaxID=1079267 RepID=A0A9P9FIN1_9HYPO|nr:hypothetical protein B0J13DRAFT_517824 [Dactylonectria estremocensis]
MTQANRRSPICHVNTGVECRHGGERDTEPTLHASFQLDQPTLGTICSVMLHCCLIIDNSQEGAHNNAHSNAQGAAQPTGWREQNAGWSNLRQLLQLDTPIVPRTSRVAVRVAVVSYLEAREEGIALAPGLATPEAHLSPAPTSIAQLAAAARAAKICHLEVHARASYMGMFVSPSLRPLSVCGLQGQSLRGQHGQHGQHSQ